MKDLFSLPRYASLSPLLRSIDLSTRFSIRGIRIAYDRAMTRKRQHKIFILILIKKYREKKSVISVACIISLDTTDASSFSSQDEIISNNLANDQKRHWEKGGKMRRDHKQGLSNYAGIYVTKLDA